MRSFKFCGPALALALAAGPAAAASVDLTGWTAEGGGTWTVQPGDDSVVQSVNGDPTVFYSDDPNAQGTALSGTIKVQTTNDDDYVGFVLGYDAGELSSATADFWLIDWKQSNQFAFSGQSFEGLALSHVSGDLSALSQAELNTDFWAHVDTVTEVARATNLGSTGWADQTEYLFELVFTPTLIQVWVDGVLEISHAGSFTDGAFGFYNFSQDNVLYAGITEEEVPDNGPPSDPPSVIPLPAGMPLLLAGIAALGLATRRRSGNI